MSSAGAPSAGLEEDPRDITDSPFRRRHSGQSVDNVGLADSVEKRDPPIGQRSVLWARHQQLHGGQIVPRLNTTPPAPMKTVIQSVLQVVVEDGESSIGAFTLPTVPTVVPFPSYGPLTVPAVPPYPSTPPQTLPTVPVYPFTTTASLPSSSAVISASTDAATSASSDVVISASSDSAVSASSNGVTSAPAIAPEPSSAIQGSNTNRTSSASSLTLQSSSSSNLPLTHSTIASASLRTSSDFPSLTAVGNVSLITFTYSDATTTFTTTSVIPLGTTSDPSSLTSTTEASASNTLSSSSETASQSSSSVLLTTSVDSSSVSATSSSSFDSSSTGIGVGGVGGGGTGTATGSSSGTSPTGGASGNGSNPGDSSSPPTPTVVGSVVGGVAGLALLAVLLLFLIRWHRRRKPAVAPAHEPEVAPPGTARSGVMTERSSNTPLAAAGIAPGFFQRFRPLSGQTTATVETTPSERGFQNLGGRKLPSMFAAGGGGMGGGMGGGSNKETLSGSSFYRDSQGNFYGGAGSPTAPGFAGPSASPAGRGIGSGIDNKDKEVAVMRPSPARTPVTSRGGFEGLPSPPRAPSTPRGTTPPAVGINPRDAVGRSRPSFTGSRGSRFTEETV